MSIVFGVILFFIGTIIGALTFKMFSKSSTEHKQLAEKAEKNEVALAQYKLDVAEHLDNSMALLNQMNTTCSAAMQQMEESTKLLQQATPVDISSMPFFSKETQEQLAQTVNLRHQKSERTSDTTISEPPLDYSGEASGLFDDKKHPVTNS